MLPNAKRESKSHPRDGSFLLAKTSWFPVRFMRYYPFMDAGLAEGDSIQKNT